MRIMMSAAASHVAPSIIRYLQILGHQIIGHDSQPFFRCDICDTFIRSPRVGPDYLKFLRNFESSYDLYLPFLDEELRHFAIYGYPANCLSSPGGTLLIFTSKTAQQKAMQDAGLPVPPEVDVIVKPAFSRGSRDIIRFQSRPSEYVVQQRVTGTEYTIDVLVDLDGKFLFAVPRERLMANGVSVVGRIVMDDNLIELAQDVVKKFKFAGPINIQIMQAPDKDYVLEVNARLSGSCIFTVLAGFDILDASVRLFEDKPFIKPEKIEEITVRRYYVEERV